MFIRDQLAKDRYSQPLNLPLNSYPAPSPYQPYGGSPMFPQVGHPQNGYANPAQYSFHKPAPPGNYQQKNSVLENKSFLDGFDNNTSGLVQQKSHARNMKRLFNNEDPSTQRVKQDKMRSYRDELQRQMEEVKERKRIERQKIQEQELNRQRKFYDEFKIQAQQNDKSLNKEGAEHLTMMRTAQNYKKKNNQIITEPNASKPAKSAVHKRGGYHNQSSLDSFEDTRTKLTSPQPDQPRVHHQQIKNKRFRSVDEELIREKNIQQERITSLMVFQQRVLQKISDIKSQIRNTSHSIDTEKELAKVRNSLRARRSHVQDPLEKSSVAHRGNSSINQFYSLPRRNVQAAPSQYSVQLKDLRGQGKPDLRGQGKPDLRGQEKPERGQQFLQSFHEKLSMNDKNIVESPQREEQD